MYEKEVMWLDECKYFARRSKDPHTQVGAFIVRPDNTKASEGYNGFYAGADDDIMEDREVKRKRVIHAEMNALLHLREQAHGYTLYTNVVPCGRCAVHIIQAGIKRVVAYDYLFFRDGLEHDTTVEEFSRAGVDLAVLHDRKRLTERESLGYWYERSIPIVCVYQIKNGQNTGANFDEATLINNFNHYWLVPPAPQICSCPDCC